MANADVDAAFAAWLDTLSESWWDDATDAGGILGTVQSAFVAGWKAREEET